MALRFKKLDSSKLITIHKPETFRVKWDAACRSNFQKSVKKFFKKYWAHHQVFEEMPIPGTRLRCDLINLTLRILVESNGTQHESYHKFFHRGNVDLFLDQMNCDIEKRRWAEQNDFKIVEIYEADMPLTPEFVLTKFGIEL